MRLNFCITKFFDKEKIMKAFVTSGRSAPLTISLLALAINALSGCATETTESRRSMGALPTAEYESVKKMRDEIVLESKKMAESRDALRQEIQTTRPQPVLTVVPPVVDVLEPNR
jgi:hypothetical protein